MAAYGAPDAATAGLMDGLHSAKTYSLRVPTLGDGEAVLFGDPAFVKAGNEDELFLADDTDADLIFGGVVVNQPRAGRSTQGEYASDEMASVLEEGRVWVRIADGVTATVNLPAYVVDDPDSDDYKTFTKHSTGNYPTNGIFRSNPVGGLAILEVRGIHNEDTEEVS